jgi:predicted PurR-regulated permease PerM
MNQPSNARVSSADVSRYVLIALALGALALLIWKLSDVLVVTFGGIVLATVLRAMSMPLSRWTHLAHRWALGIVLVVLLGVGIGAFYLFGNQVATQTAELQQQLPTAVQKFEAYLNKSQVGRSIVQTVNASSITSTAWASAKTVAGVVVSAVADILLILFLSLYFAFDPEVYKRGFLLLVPPPRRHEVGRALDESGEALGKWLLAQVIAMATVGVLVWIGLTLIHVPLALALGVLAGILEFVPVLGPILFSIPGILLAFANSPQTAFYALLVYLIVQQIEGNVLIPLLQRWAVHLAPVVGLIAVVACGVLFGVTGVVFATPMAVVITTLVQRLYVKDALDDPNAPTLADQDEKTKHRAQARGAKTI